MDEAIERAAMRFRSALDRIDTSHWAVHHIQDFPCGSCGHCAEMIGRFLREQLGIEATYVSANFWIEGKAQGHAWVEFDGLIIDISADQFGLPRVIVTRFSSFHSKAFDVIRIPLNRDGNWWSANCSQIWDAAHVVLARD